MDHLPPINQFPHLYPITQPGVINSPSVWVASGGLPGTQGQADAARLARIGFVAGVQEELGDNMPTVAEVDAEVEQFHTAAAAGDELGYRIGQARATGTSPGYTFSRLAVAGVPGAFGYAIKQPASSGDAVLFAAGPYFYLIQSVLPAGSQNVVTSQQLTADATAWYRHLKAL